MRAALGVRAVHDRDVLEPVDGARRPRRPARARTEPAGPASGHERLDLARDPLGLLVLAVGLEALDEHAARVLGPELLVLAALVARHDRVRGVEDELRRAVVLLQLDDRRVGVVALEVEDVAQVRAAPAVDALVVVADDGEVVVLAARAADPEVLRAVRVLVLVDVQVAPALLVVGEDRPGACSKRRTASLSRSSKSSAAEAFRRPGSGRRPGRTGLVVAARELVGLERAR